MRNETNVRGSRVALAAILLLICAWVTAPAQSPSTQSPVEPAQTQTQTPGNQATEPLRQLNLTPDQIQKIRGINAELKDQRQTAGQKLRLAQRALAEAIESPTPNEALIEQRSHELADAQAATIRLRSLTEARILQVLTPEQRIRLREIRLQNQAARREANQQQPGNGANRRQRGLQRGVNANPLLSPNQRKQIRRQSKP